MDTGDISDELSDARIREKIRDEYLRDSTGTIVLVGTETKRRKHVDWEIYSSMYIAPSDLKKVLNSRSDIGKEGPMSYPMSERSLALLGAICQNAV